MDIGHSLKNYGKYFVLPAFIIAFIVIISAEGYCDLGFNGGFDYDFSLVRCITLDHTLAYEGQTITIRGSGFNSTPYPGDLEPTVLCNAYCYPNGTMKPIKVQADGTFVVQPTVTAAGEDDIYAKDRWGSMSNLVHLKVTQPVTIKLNIVDGQNTPYVTNGVLCMKYPASGSSHSENTIIGSSYTTKMAFNGTSAEVWIRQIPLATDHQVIQNIEEGKTYSVTLTMPVNTPVPSPSSSPSPQAGTPTPSPSPAPSSNQPNLPPTLSGAPDTVAPATTLNLTGLKDASGGFTTNVVCTLTAVDNEGGSGVNNTTYSFDGNDWLAYTGAFTVSTPGNKMIFYRSVDRAGNQEVAKVETFFIAGSASATTAQGSGCMPALALPLLCGGLAGLYGIRKMRQK